MARTPAHVLWLVLENWMLTRARTWVSVGRPARLARRGIAGNGRDRRSGSSRDTRGARAPGAVIFDVRATAQEMWRRALFEAGAAPVQVYWLVLEKLMLIRRPDGVRCLGTQWRQSL